VDLTRAIPRLKHALTDARRSDLARIDEGLRRFGVTGVHGEPEVGVSALVEAAVHRANQRMIRLDLDGAASAAHVAWMLAHELARTVIHPRWLSLLAAPDMAPTAARRELVSFAETVGQDVADLAIAPRPTDDVGVGKVLDAIEKVWGQAAAPPLLWIDHLQTPTLTPRHPVDVDALLWAVRDLHQRMALPIIVSGNSAVSEIAYRRTGAFFGDGVWVTIGRPGTDVWLEAADRANVFADRVEARSWVADMVAITHGHPSTMMLALAWRMEAPGEARTSLELWQLMLGLDDGHTARAMQHARTLHRLGGQVFEQIAAGAGPYEGAAGPNEQKERGRAVSRLHAAGLVMQPRKRVWEVTNPLVAARLRGKLPVTTREAFAYEAQEEPAV